MKLTIVGSGTALPQRGRGAPCCLVQGGGRNIVVDLGSGSVRGLLLQAGITPADVGLILLTHLHPDHCVDLVSFLFSLRSEDLARTDPLMILGPEGLEEHYRDLRKAWGRRVEASGYDLSLKDWPGPDLHWGPFLLRAAPTVHSARNLAWYLGGPGEKGVILTGDGEGTDELVRMGRKARHVMVAECSVPAGSVTAGHMNPAQAGELARKCGSNSLVLTHLNPGVEPEAARSDGKRHFGGAVTVAEDGMVMEI